MRFKISLHPKTGELVLPNNYQRPLSAALWKNLNIPHIKESTEPKLISISTLISKERLIEKDNIRIKSNQVGLYISSPLQEILEAIHSLKGAIEIAGNLLDIGTKTIIDDPDFEESMTWQTLSGICTKIKNEDKKSYYINPRKNKELCEESIKSSLFGKWVHLSLVDEKKSIRWCEDKSPISWANENKPSVEILKYDSIQLGKIKQDAPISSWKGLIKITGHPAWQRLIWDCGAGSKTGLGNGCIQLITKQ